MVVEGVEPPFYTDYEPDELPCSTLPITLDRTRTYNPLCVRQMLYLLSYQRIIFPATPSDTPTLLRLNTHY